MAKTTEANKALVLEAFDTLFNKHDYKVAERYWSSNYIQHSAHIPPGRDGLFNPDQKPASNAEVRAGHDRCRGRLRDCPWPVFQHRKAEELDLCRCRPRRRWCARGALGRSAGRSNRSRVAKRSADVRDQIFRLRSWARAARPPGGFRNVKAMQRRRFCLTFLSSP